MTRNTILPGTGESYAAENITEANEAGTDVEIKYQKVKLAFGVDGLVEVVSPFSPLPVADDMLRELVEKLVIQNGQILQHLQEIAPILLEDK